MGVELDYEQQTAEMKILTAMAGFRKHDMLQ